MWQNRSICQSGTRSLEGGTESCPLMMGLGLSRNCASWVSLAVEIYTGRGGKSPRLSGMEEAQEMDESNRLTDKDEDGVPFHD